MNAILLLAVCAVAAVWPVLGIAAIFVLTATLFHLDQYFTVALPVGYIEPPEAILAVIAARALLVRVAPRRWRAWPGPHPGNSSIDAVLVGAVLPYFAWQTLCVVLGAIDWAGTEYFRYTARYYLSAVFPWLGLFVLRALSKDVPKLFPLLFHIALATAVVHIAIQVLDIRSVMQLAYWRDTAGEEFGFLEKSRLLWLSHEEFVRGLPQGLHLMLFCAVFDFATFINERFPRGAWPLVRGCILSAGLLVTITRAVVVCILAGVLIAAVLYVFASRRSVPVLVKAPALALMVLLGAVAYDQVRPGFLDAWKRRIAALSGVDVQIFSESNLARGVDNVASVSAIAEHPVFGIGTPRYPPEYSLRNTPPTDIHPLLTVGLVGGIPAIFLVLRLQLMPLLHFARRMRARAAPRSIVPHTAALGMSALALNVIGGGGSLERTGVFIIAVFLAAAAHEIDVYGAAYPRVRAVAPAAPQQQGIPIWAIRYRGSRS